MCEPLEPVVPLDFLLFFLLLPLPSLLDHDLLCLPLPDDCLPVCLACIAVSLNMCSTALKHPSRRLDDPFPLSDERELTASTSMGFECPREPVSLGLESRILKPNFASTYATTSKHASSNVRMRFELRIRCFPSSSGTNDPRPSELDLVVHLVLHLLLVARRVGLPAFDPRLECQKRTSSRRNERAQNVPFPSSCRRIITLLQSPPCLQRSLPRVGDNAVRLINS